MTSQTNTFDQSRWADATFAREYLDHADHYIPDRHYLFHVLRSFHRCFAARPGGTRVCDLGCGDGILMGQLLEEDSSIHPTLVDGSTDMIAAARQRLSHRTDAHWVQKSFAELIQDSSVLGLFDLVVSGFAIHHLLRPERRGLFDVVFRHLHPGARFLNLDVALSENAGATEWQFKLWQEWIDAHSARHGLGDQFHEVPRQARENPDNQYGPLADQLADLAAAGFVEVECHYRNGPFALYAGRRPQS